MTSEYCPVCFQKLIDDRCMRCGYTTMDNFLDLRTIDVPMKADIIKWQSFTAKNNELKKKQLNPKSDKVHNYKGPYRQNKEGLLWVVDGGKTTADENTGEYSIAYKKPAKKKSAEDSSRKENRDKNQNDNNSGEYSFSYRKVKK